MYRYLMIMILIIFVAGCQDESYKTPAGGNDHTLPQNIIYSESYNEKTTSFRKQWPSEMIGGLGKTTNEAVLLMTDYEYVEKTMAIDKEGYLHMSTRYLEGDANLTMPEKDYEALKDKMPARDPSADPVVAVDISNGTMSFTTKYGTRDIASMPYNLEERRIDIDDFQEAMTQPHDDLQAKILGDLQNSGIQYQMLNQRYVSYEATFDECGTCDDDTIDDDLAGVKRVVDVTNGQVIRKALMRTDGRYDSVSLMSYQNVSGIWVMKTQRTYTMGDIAGEWRVKYVTYVERDHIDVVFKPTI